MKRLMDVLLSVSAMLFLLPFMIPVMIALKLTGEHDIFYGQERVGRGGRHFKLWKFATMMRNSSMMPGGDLTQKDDPRILPLGGFLRKTKINELPQIVNIVVGDMSIVGPRPLTPKHFALYSSDVQETIGRVRPGLTGVGSLVFRDEENMLDRVPGDRTEFHAKVNIPYKGQLEGWFAEHNTISVYIKVIILTAWSVLFPNSKLYTKVLKDLPLPPSELKPYL